MNRPTVADVAFGFYFLIAAGLFVTPVILLAVPVSALVFVLGILASMGNIAVLLNYERINYWLSRKLGLWNYLLSSSHFDNDDEFKTPVYIWNFLLSRRDTSRWVVIPLCKVDKRIVSNMSSESIHAMKKGVYSGLCVGVMFMPMLGTGVHVPLVCGSNDPYLDWVWSKYCNGVEYWLDKHRFVYIRWRVKCLADRWYKNL